MAQVAIMLITIPVFLPIIYALGFDPVWFAVIAMINMEMAGISPPFGLTLFALKGIVPSRISMKDIYMASLPFVACDVVVILLVTAFPGLATFLIGMMGKS
jgi:TRAP-type mannitol/chloroaromatic compound transport system permease large subunit